MLTSSIALAQLGPGDILFVGYNGDGNDGLAFVAISDIPANDTIRFTDEEWNGTAFGTSEGDFYWTNSAATPSGTVVYIGEISTSSLTASVGTAGLAGSIAYLGASNEVVYAYIGGLRAPTAFLAAIGNDSFSSNGDLTGTGLTEGVNALNITGDEDVAEYVGPRTGFTTTSIVAEIMNLNNWITQDGSGDQSNDATAPDVPFNTSSFTLSIPTVTVHNVTNSGVTFVPAVLSIALGDSVHWSMVGNHNVNGDQGTYPANPESFYSGPPPVASFGHRFMTSGNYTYQCDPHFGFGMIGTIEVQGPLNDVTNLAVSSNGEDEVTVSWNDPNGANGVDWDGVMVFMSESPFSDFFLNNAQEASTYTGNFAFGAGTVVSADGTNNGYCIYNSSSAMGSNSISVDGLMANTTYYAVAYAYTAESGNDNVSNEASANATTDAPPTSSDLMIVGSMDGPLTGGHPKVVELIAVNDVMDASEYSVMLYGNGSSSPTVTVSSLPAMSMTAGDRYYITGDSTGFYTFFGFAADAIGSTFLNGDDALGLQRNGVLVDAMGEIGVDGTGQCWEWLDGWGYRNNGGSPSVVFNCADWTFSGINALDGESSNATAAVPYPIGSYGVVSTVDLEITEVMPSSSLANTSIDGDWFEIRNNGGTSVDLSGFSWSAGTQTPGTHTFGSYLLPAGQSVIVIDEDLTDVLAWTNEWNQTANNIRVIARDENAIGFTDINAAADVVYLFDDSNNLLSSAVFASSASGVSLEFNMGVPTNSVDGVNGAYTSNGGDIGSPSDVAPVVITIPTYDISQVRGVDASGVSDSDGVYCRIHGVVTSIDFDGNGGYSFYITDGSQGINVFSFNDVSGYTSPMMGDSLSIVGTIDQFSGLIEIVPDSLTLLTSGANLPAPMSVMTLDESTESELITFSNVTLVDTAAWPTSATSTNVDFITSAGDTLTLRIDFDASIFGNTPTGTFNLTGIGSQYDNSTPYLSGYQIFPRSSADIDPVYSCVGIDSIVGVNVNKGVYRAYFGSLSGTDFRLEYKATADTVWRTKSIADGNQGSQRFNVTPSFGTDIMVRIATMSGGMWTSGCESMISVPCKSQSLSIVVQKDARCTSDSVLVRAGYAGGYGAASFMWSNGATTKRTYASQGETLYVTVTDASGCSVSDTITASSFDNTAVPMGFALNKDNATTFTGTWTTPSLPSGASLIGYRMAYRLRNTQSYTNLPTTTSNSATVDFTGSGLAAGNYEFVVFTRYNDGASVVNSNFSCIDVKGYNGSGNKTDWTGASNATAAVNVYPNPTSGELFTSAPQGSKVVLMDVNGRLIASQIVTTSGVKFDISALSEGVYMLRIQTNDETITERIIKNQYQIIVLLEASHFARLLCFLH